MADIQQAYNYKTALATLNNVSLVALIASFQLHYKLFFNISLICFGVSFLVEYIYVRGWRDWHWRRVDTWFVSLLMLWLIFPLSLPLTGYGPEFKHEMEKSLSFLLIGTIGLMHSPHKAPIRVAAWTFIATAVVINIIILILTDWHAVVSDQRHLMAIEVTRATYFGAHMRFNLCQNMALLSAAYIMYKAPHRKERIAAAVAAPFILLMTFTSQGRIGIITAIILTAGLIIVSLRGRARLLGTLAAAIALAAGFFFMQGMQSMQQYDKMSGELLKTEPRFMIWKSATSVIAQHPLGLGVDKGMETLHENNSQYPSLRDNGLYNTHAHNLWLQYTLYFGVLGFLLISAVMFLLPFVVDKDKLVLISFTLLPFVLEGAVDVFGSGLPQMLFLIPMWVIVESKTS